MYFKGVWSRSIFWRQNHLWPPPPPIQAWPVFLQANTTTLGQIIIIIFISIIIIALLITITITITISIIITNSNLTTISLPPSKYNYSWWDLLSHSFPSKLEFKPLIRQIFPYFPALHWTFLGPSYRGSEFTSFKKTSLGVFEQVGV